MKNMNLRVINNDEKYVLPSNDVELNSSIKSNKAKRQAMALQWYLNVQFMNAKENSSFMTSCVHSAYQTLLFELKYATFPSLPWL